MFEYKIYVDIPLNTFPEWIVKYMREHEFRYKGLILVYSKDENDFYIIKNYNIF